MPLFICYLLMQLKLLSTGNVTPLKTLLRELGKSYLSTCSKQCKIIYVLRIRVCDLWCSVTLYVIYEESSLFSFLDKMRC